MNGSDESITWEEGDVKGPGGKYFSKVCRCTGRGVSFFMQDRGWSWDNVRFMLRDRVPAAFNLNHKPYLKSNNA